MNVRPGARVPRSLLLFGSGNIALDVLATGATALLVVVSRFAFLADGPWEWDETLFARGILHFELAAHFPHPPGFPGWLAIGHLVDLVVGDPLRALQLASAAFSVAALWALAAIGRRVASPPVAAAAALLVLATPGPWLFAVRGFSSTAAAVLALGAVAVAVGGLGGARVTVFTLLVTASFLVRPNVLPVLATLWLGVAWSVRPRRRLLPGVAAGAAAVGLSVLLMARAEGGWAAFVTPFLAHSQRHFSRLVNNLGGYSDLGLVTGLGGVLPATTLFTAAAIGVVVWGRRVSRRGALLWALVLVIAVAQLVWLQNRTTSRYAVGVQMALAPLIAATASILPPAAGCAVLLGSAGWFGVGSWPLVEEQHTTELAAWRAVTAAREDALANGRTVVLEPELHPFASYLWHMMERRHQPNPPWVLSPWDPGPWAGVDGSWVVATVHRHLYPDGLAGRERCWGGVSARLRPLTQDRFLDAWLIEEPPLPLESWWPREHTLQGRAFMWGGTAATLELPPMAAGTELGVAFRPAPGAEPLGVVLNGEVVATVGGEGEERRLWLPVPASGTSTTSRLLFERARGYPPGDGDSRQLSVQLFELRALRPGAPWAGSVAHWWEREALRIELEGAYEAEDFLGTGEGVWLGPYAVLRVPASTGRLRLRLWAPRPTPPRTVIRVGGRVVSGPLDIGPSPRDVAVDVLAGEVAGGRLEIELVSHPYRPSDTGVPDPRDLGVVLSFLEFEPAGSAS